MGDYKARREHHGQPDLHEHEPSNSCKLIPTWNHSTSSAMHPNVTGCLQGHFRSGGLTAKAWVNKSTRHQKLDAKGKPHPCCKNFWFKFITFSSVDLQRKIKIFDPTGNAVLAPCAWTTIKSQANILPTTPGLPQPFPIKAPEDKCTDQCVHCHQSALQINKNQFLLFHKPYFSAITCALMGRPGNMTAWALWSFF